MRCSYDIAAIGLIAVLTAFHIALALHFPLASDETYYWEWSRQLDWGYYDQGPLIAWLIRAATAVFGSTEFGVRAGIVLCGALTLWFLYRAGAVLFHPRVGLLALACSGVTPMATAGGFVATYDALLVLFWTWALYLMATLIQDRSSSGRLDRWLLLGVVGGAGLLSKVTMALFLPCVLLFLAGAPQSRRLLRHAGFYLAIVVALLVYSPNLWWQSQHGWVTFAHVLGLTDKGGQGRALKQLGDFIGSQFGLISPLLAGGMLVALWHARSACCRPDAVSRWLVFSMSAPVLLLFTLLALKTKVQANWAICGWIGAAVAYAAWVEEGRGRRHAYAGVALASAALLSILAGWPALRVAIGIRVPARLDQSRKMYGGRELAAAWVREKERMVTGGRPVVPGAATYDVTSRLAFYLPGQPHAHCFFLGTRDNQYRYLNRASGLRRGDHALIADHRPPDDPLLVPFHSVFDRVEPVAEPVVVYVRGIYKEPVVTYYLYRCYGYRGGADVATSRQ